MDEDLPAELDLVPADEGLEEFVARHLPDYAPRLGWEERFGPYLVGTMAVVVVAAAVVGPAELATGGALLALVLISMLVGGVLGEGVAQALHRGEVRRHQRVLRERPWEIQSRVLERFRSRIEVRREELLGPRSTAEAARRPLKEAKEDAERALAYWRERAGQDADDPVVASNLAFAEDLADKVGRALASLDRRHDALRHFFDRCDAKLAALDQGRQDAEESQRLRRLADRAEAAVYDAEAALQAIADRFLRDAREIASALAGLERADLLREAERAPLSEVEVLAERILASEKDAEEDLQRLAASVSGPSPHA